VKSGSVDATPTWRTAQATRLTNVLQAYALRDPHVGYCQGMNEIGKSNILIIVWAIVLTSCFVNSRAFSRRRAG